MDGDRLDLQGPPGRKRRFGSRYWLLYKSRLKKASGAGAVARPVQATVAVRTALVLSSWCWGGFGQEETTMELTPKLSGKEMDAISKAIKGLTPRPAVDRLLAA
jgi:hypothetical protein